MYIPVFHIGSLLLHSHDNTGKLAPGSIGASSMQRQWIGLSVTGDEVTVEPIPFSPSYLQSLDIEVGFLRRGHEIAETFSADEMARNFIKAFSSIIFTAGQMLVFEFHGQNLRAQIKGLSVLELADAQRRGGSGASTAMGVLMEKTDVTFMKAGDSAIKIKSSAKK